MLMGGSPRCGGDRVNRYPVAQQTQCFSTGGPQVSSIRLAGTARLSAVTLADGLQHEARAKTQARLTATVSTPE
jgi:hypothetical protein